MAELPSSLQYFIEILSRFPGIGPRQAMRLAFWFIRQPIIVQKKFILTINNLLQKTRLCPRCFFVFDKSGNQNLCSICSDSSRDQTIICVVAKETDLLSLEKTKKYRGLYHILGGLLSPLEPEKENKLTINSLLNRIKRKGIKEVILAINPTSEGNLTVMHLEKKLKPFNIKITRLARGIPTGGEIEFADSETLSSALEGRK